MAKNSEIIVRHELRPCMVTSRKGGEEKRALFHCWNHWAQTVSASLLRGGAPAGQHAETYGVVEFEDGTVKSVYPEQIRFLDSPFADYYWNEEEAQE